MKILIFLDDPSSAHDVVREVSRMAVSPGNEFEVHLSRVLNFGGIRASAQPVLETVSAGVGVGRARDMDGRTHANDISAANEYLARLSHRYFPGAITKSVVFGNTPVAEIIAYAKREAINMIVIAEGTNRSIAQMLQFEGSVPLFKVSVE